MYTRSKASRKSILYPVRERRDLTHEIASSATHKKDRTSLATKQHFRNDSHPLASALCLDHRNRSLRPQQSRRFLMLQKFNSMASRAAILSGLPSINTHSFSECPISGKALFVGAHDHRPGQMPLPREDISHTRPLMSSTPPPGTDVIPNFYL